MDKTSTGPTLGRAAAILVGVLGFAALMSLRDAFDGVAARGLLAALAFLWGAVAVVLAMKC